jgi:hypothetical protein
VKTEVLPSERAAIMWVIRVGSGLGRNRDCVKDRLCVDSLVSNVKCSAFFYPSSLAGLQFKILLLEYLFYQCLGSYKKKKKKKAKRVIRSAEIK